MEFPKEVAVEAFLNTHPNTIIVAPEEFMEIIGFTLIDDEPEPETICIDCANVMDDDCGKLIASDSCTHWEPIFRTPEHDPILICDSCLREL